MPLNIALNAVIDASIAAGSEPIKMCRPLEKAVEGLYRCIEDIEVRAFMRGKEAGRKELKHEKYEQRLRALEDRDIEKRCIKPKTNKPITRWGKGWKTQS